MVTKYHIQKLKSKHLVCLSFLRWQSFWGNKRKYFTHIPGLSQFSLFFLIEEKESISLKMTCIWKSCRTFKFLSSNQSYFYFGWAVWHSINQNHSKCHLFSEWIYEVIVSPKIRTKNCRDFCPVYVLRVEILTIFCSYFGRNDDFINSFWN